MPVAIKAQVGVVYPHIRIISVLFFAFSLLTFIKIMPGTHDIYHVREGVGKNPYETL